MNDLIVIRESLPNDRGFVVDAYEKGEHKHTVYITHEGIRRIKDSGIKIEYKKGEKNV